MSREGDDRMRGVDRFRRPGGSLLQVGNTHRCNIRNVRDASLCAPMKVLPILAALSLGPVAFGIYACSSSSGGSPSNPTGDAGAGDSAQPPFDSSLGDTSQPLVDSATDTGSSDSPITDGGVNRGPTTLNFGSVTGAGDCQSIWWDDAHQVLYVADGPGNQIWKWTDTAGFSLYAKVVDNPAADDAGDNQLDKLIQLAEGTLVVPRFGYGTYGAILTVAPDGGAGEVAD